MNAEAKAQKLKIYNEAQAAITARYKGRKREDVPLNELVTYGTDCTAFTSHMEEYSMVADIAEIYGIFEDASPFIVSYMDLCRGL